MGIQLQRLRSITLPALPHPYAHPLKAFPSGLTLPPLHCACVCSKNRAELVLATSHKVVLTLPCTLGEFTFFTLCFAVPFLTATPCTLG